MSEKLDKLIEDIDSHRQAVESAINTLHAYAEGLEQDRDAPVDVIDLEPDPPPPAPEGTPFDRLGYADGILHINRGESFSGIWILTTRTRSAPKHITLYKLKNSGTGPAKIRLPSPELVAAQAIRASGTPAVIIGTRQNGMFISILVRNPVNNAWEDYRDDSHHLDGDTYTGTPIFGGVEEPEPEPPADPFPPIERQTGNLIKDSKHYDDRPHHSSNHRGVVILLDAQFTGNVESLTVGNRGFNLASVANGGREHWRRDVWLRDLIGQTLTVHLKDRRILKWKIRDSGDPHRIERWELSR